MPPLKLGPHPQSCAVSTHRPMKPPCSLQARRSGSGFRGRATPTKHHVARVRVARAFAELREPEARARTGTCERACEGSERRFPPPRRTENVYLSTGGSPFPFCANSLNSFFLYCIFSTTPHSLALSPSLPISYLSFSLFLRSLFTSFNAFYINVMLSHCHIVLL